MKTVFDLGDGLELAVAERAPASSAGGRSRDAVTYPTAGLQKGLLLLDGGEELSVEGVGFGVPVLKRGVRAVFPGSAEIVIDREASTVTLIFTMDRVERLGGRDASTLAHRPLDAAREAFALLYRRAPLARRPLMAVSNAIRWILRARTHFEQTAPVAVLPVTYTAGDHRGDVVVTADLAHLPGTVTEIVLMNELGADAFDHFTDSDGADVRGARIGAWNEVRAAKASFSGGRTGVSFALDRVPDPGVPGARLYRGREVARGRLAWAGFGYSLKPGPRSFTYTLHVRRGEVLS